MNIPREYLEAKIAAILNLEKWNILEWKEWNEENWAKTF
jgi:hypothetical protein